jgi:hypothetical protein
LVATVLVTKFSALPGSKDGQAEQQEETFPATAEGFFFVAGV